MENPRILFFGTPSFAASILQTLIDEKYQVIAAISQPDRPVGRKHVITPSPVHVLADENNIPFLAFEKLKDHADEVIALQPDLIVTCAYGQFVPTKILECPSLGALNIHPSLLPKYRGGAPIHHAIMHGDSETGVSLMEMTKAMDAGKVFAQVHVPIGEDETQKELSERLVVESRKLLKENLPKYLKGELPGVEQDESLVTFGYNITREEEQVHFETEDIDTLYNHIRALIDWPVSYGLMEGKRMKFHGVRKNHEASNALPGTILGFEGDAMLVACLGGTLLVKELQMEGKGKMDAKSFANGAGRSLIGKRFD